ncbi:MAG: choice-of-anchor A family protein [Terracidiphilus sp.]
MAVFSAHAVSQAASAPLGAASAFNLVALGTVNARGKTVIPGNVGTSSDVGGRIAAANDITEATAVGSELGSSSDPFGWAANGYVMVAGTGVTATGYFNINGGGNVYALANSANYNWNESPIGSLTPSGPDPINFTALAAALGAVALNLETLTPNGTVVLGAAPANPSWLVLSGTSATLNVFTLTAVQFASVNNPLDIEVPAGSTVIINVDGTNVSLGAAIYVNGQRQSTSNSDGADILFNFADAAAVNFDAALYGSVLAPFATFNGNSELGGTLIAAQIDSTGEVDNIEFGGKLPRVNVPEGGAPWLYLLLAGAACCAGFVIKRRAAARMATAA